MDGEARAADPEAPLEQGMAAGMQELLTELPASLGTHLPCSTRRFSLQRGEDFLSDAMVKKTCCGGNGAWVKQPTTVPLIYHLFTTGI